MRNVLVALVGMLLAPAVAAAQTGGPIRRTEVFGVVASETLTDDESSLGTSLMGGAGVRYRLSERVDVGRLLYHFSQGKARPYVAGTGGYLSLTRSSAFPIVSPGPGFGRPIVTGYNTFERSLNEPLWGGGGGLDLRLTERLSVRPEASLLWSVPSNYVGLQFGAAVGVRW
jgi:hypothetical protein